MAIYQDTRTQPDASGQPGGFKDTSNRANWRGMWVLYVKEVRRFTSVYTQTILAPAVTTLLFLAVFTLALGGAVREVWGVSFSSFIAPGLVMMAIMQNAFANTSSSMTISKVQGNIVDVLMPPLSARELTLGYALGGMTRGLCVGLFVGVVMAFFVPVTLSDPLLVILFAAAASLMLSLLGVIGGIWADKFDHIAAVTNFIITPLTFLSGTFYSIDRLPETWYAVAHVNPFFYLIDGFRHGFLGRSDSDPWLGLLIVMAVNLALWILTHRLFAAGYKLKA